MHSPITLGLAIGLLLLSAISSGFAGWSISERDRSLGTIFAAIALGVGYIAARVLVS